MLELVYDTGIQSKHLGNKNRANFGSRKISKEAHNVMSEVCF